MRNSGIVKLTAQGKTYGFLLLAVLVAAINYSNSLAFIICFILTGIGMAAYYQTRKELTQIELASIRTGDVYAGQQAGIELELQNLSGADKPALFVVIEVGDLESTAKEAVFLKARSRSRSFAPLLCPRRGIMEVTALRIETLFPLGLFRGVRKLYHRTRFYVFPAPVGNRPWPEPLGRWRDWVDGSHSSGGDDFAGLRPYRTGETQRHVDWKAYARGRPMSVKEFSGGGQVQLWFDWDQLGGAGTEARLSQLCRWILDAHKFGIEFGLKLPGREIRPHAGSEHKRDCLLALTEFKVT